MRGFHQYKAARTQSASKPQIVLMLFQEAIQRIIKAEMAVGSNNRQDAIQHAHHIRSIMMELMASLDDSVAPELCAQLRSLYSWSFDEMVKFGRDLDPNRLDGVSRVLSSLLEGWQAAVRSPEAAP